MKGPVLAPRCPARGTISQGIQEHFRKYHYIFLQIPDFPVGSGWDSGIFFSASDMFLCSLLCSIALY